MSRQIQEIRNGRKHGPVTSYVTSANFSDLNPFVLWDHFHIPHVQGKAGFGFHGHSGVATISYPQIGAIAHEDTGGHSGLLKAGGIQIMSAGSGVLHKETVHPDRFLADAFQLWVALPAKELEMGPVTYSTQQQDDIAVVEEDHATTKVLIGRYKEVQSLVQAPVDMTYLHVHLKAEARWQHLASELQTTAFIYVRRGSVAVGNAILSSGELGVFEKNYKLINVTADGQLAEFLIISGTPLDQELISNGPSVHSNLANLNAGAQRIKQLQLQGVSR
ncbi:pirin family protein [Vibrio sp. Vb2880]|uniref:pirin family protein n=1 Tax=Vibrio sp. Vb2880 TaxID=2816076 RepID=UPI00296514DF|nr:pirin family protein [Vibrio sp. Vb2880]MDW1575577.1 pirin family protein [Vibrio sp. Vb2880]